MCPPVAPACGVPLSAPSPHHEEQEGHPPSPASNQDPKTMSPRKAFVTQQRTPRKLPGPSLCLDLSGIWGLLGLVSARSHHSTIPTRLRFPLSAQPLWEVALAPWGEAGVAFSPWGSPALASGASRPTGVHCCRQQSLLAYLLCSWGCCDLLILFPCPSPLPPLWSLGYLASPLHWKFCRLRVARVDRPWVQVSMDQQSPPSAPPLVA